MKEFISKRPEDTIRLGKALGGCLKDGDVVALVGELGSGKTTLTKGIARGLGVRDAKYVNSPSFVIIKEYEGRVPLYHFDLYRLDEIGDVETTGYEEYFEGNGVCVIEWADKITDLLPKTFIKIKLQFKTENSRVIKLYPRGSRYERIAGKVR